MERDFTADAPNRLWAMDLTYVPTWSGIAYVCFIVDAFSRRIVGWRVAANMRTAMVLDALEMARWQRGTRLDGLVAHSDAGSQFTSVRYGERLAEIVAVPSIGTVGDSFDNALAETVNGLYKTELIYGPDQGPWRTIQDVELATLSWVALVQHAAPPRIPQRPPPSRIRSRLRCRKENRTAGWKPIETVSNEPSTHQSKLVRSSGATGCQLLCRWGQHPSRRPGLGFFPTAP